MQKPVEDYLSFGVPSVFILDPAARKSFPCTLDGLTEVAEPRIGSPEIGVPLAELFED